jgi:hypothetical protein
MPRTRSANLDDFMFNMGNLIHMEVFFVIKFDTLCPGDGTYPANPDNEEKERIKQLKKDCYKETVLKLKKAGVFSSDSKKLVLKHTLREIIIDTIDRDERHNSDMDASRISRGFVAVSVLRAVLNALKNTKLSDVKLPAFDDVAE